MARKLEVQIIGDASSLTSAFSRAANSANGFGSRMSGAVDITKKAMTIGSAAIGGGLAYIIHQAAGFQDELNTFQAVSKATGAQMKQVSSLAKKLGADITL